MDRDARSTKHLCQGCGQHAAKFEYRGRWKFRADHDLCPRCYRSQRDRDRAGSMGRA